LPERAFAGEAYVDGDLVFCRRARRPHPPATAHRVVQHTSEGGRHPAGSLHVLRHTAATLALTSGIPVHIVAARLGDNPTTLLDVYAHLLPTSDELAAERVAALLA
jgi:site-specific recombinase XerD